MPKLTADLSESRIKLLLIGDHGSGKTGALASLARAGYNLRILDFDNGLNILRNVLRGDPAISRITFATLTDKLKQSPLGLVPAGTPRAFMTALKLLTNWKTEDEDLGPLETWTSQDIIVIDSLTFLSKAAFLYVDVTKGYKDPRQTYGESQKLVEGVLGLLHSGEISCHVIVISHITYIEADGAPLRGYPQTIGRALSPSVGAYFNSCLMCASRGTGKSTKRLIYTQPQGLVELKTEFPPDQLPTEFPLETGLADYFAIVLGKKPAAKAASKLTLK